MARAGHSHAFPSGERHYYEAHAVAGEQCRWIIIKTAPAK